MSRRRCSHETVTVVEEATERIITTILPDGSTINTADTAGPTGMAEVDCVDCGVVYRLSWVKPPKRTPLWVRRALDVAIPGTDTDSGEGS